MISLKLTKEKMSESTPETTTPETTDERIVKLLDRISKSEAYKAGAWRRVVEEAKKYAMMKSFGTYLEVRGNNECMMHVGHSEREQYTKMFADNVLRYSLDALAESSIGF